MPKAGTIVYVMSPGWGVERMSILVKQCDAFYVRPADRPNFSLVKYPGGDTVEEVSDDCICVKTSSYDEMLPYQRLVARLRETLNADSDPELGAPRTSRYAMEEYIRNTHPELTHLLDAQEDY